MKRKSILSIALISFIAPSIFAAGVSSVESELSTTTVTSLSGKTVTYTNSSGTAAQEFVVSSEIKSDYELKVSSETSVLGYETIEKFLVSTEDGSYSSKFYDIDILDFGDSTNYNVAYNYYWDSEGKLTTTVGTADELAFTVYADKTSGNDHVEETGSNGAGVSNSSTTSYAVNFISNTATLNGGGIYNTGSITSIDSEFIANTASGGHGGGIYNASSITSITGDFILNTANGYSGGAIYNYNSASIGTIVGDFIANTASTWGGAINNTNSSTIDLIIGDFIGNSTLLLTDSAGESVGNGGAINNISSSKIGTIIGNFIGNDTANSGAISNTASSTIYSIEGDFIHNTAGKNAGAIYNAGADSIIYSIVGDFVENSADVAGGAIYNSAGTISSIVGDFIENSAVGNNGGAIYNNAGTITSLSANFVGNYAGNYGGAIYNNSGTISIETLSSDIFFEGNYSGTSSTSNAIFNSGSSTASSTINFKASGDYSIIINDGISGWAATDEYQILNITGGTVEFNNYVFNNTVNVNSGTLKLGSYAGGLEISSSYTTSSSTANLNNVTLTVASGATLSIGANSNVTLSNSSSITMSEGSSILFEAYASLTFDSTSTINFYDISNIKIDISDFDIGSTSYTFIYTDSSESAQAIYDALLNEDLTVYSSTEDIGDVVNDINFALDGSNITLTVFVSGAVPEPSTYAMIIGLLSLGFVAYKRRKQ